MLAVPGGPAADAAKPGMLAAWHERGPALFAVPAIRQRSTRRLAPAPPPARTLVISGEPGGPRGISKADGQPGTPDGWLVNRAVMLLRTTGDCLACEEVRAATTDHYPEQL